MWGIRCPAGVSRGGRRNSPVSPHSGAISSEKLFSEALRNLSAGNMESKPGHVRMGPLQQQATISNLHESDAACLMLLGLPESLGHSKGVNVEYRIW